jgi:anti-sigma B factor antagonist
MSEERDTAVVALEGEIDLAAAPEAERRIAEAEARKPALLVVDLREVTFMDSSGLRVLLTAHRRAEQAGRGFALVKGGQAVGRLLEVTGLSDRLELLDEPPTGSGRAPAS